MTREEAIEVLKKSIEDLEYYVESELKIDAKQQAKIEIMALEMAIKSLEHDIELERLFNELKQTSDNSTKNNFEVVLPYDHIVVPRNATNGDMIKALFPNMSMANDREWFVHLQDGKGNIMKMSKDWWNALYKRGRWCLIQ